MTLALIFPKKKNYRVIYRVVDTDGVIILIQGDQNNGTCKHHLSHGAEDCS